MMQFGTQKNVEKINTNNEDKIYEYYLNYIKNKQKEISKNQGDLTYLDLKNNNSNYNDYSFKFFVFLEFKRIKIGDHYITYSYNYIVFYQLPLSSPHKLAILYNMEGDKFHYSWVVYNQMLELSNSYMNNREFDISTGVSNVNEKELMEFSTSFFLDLNIKLERVGKAILKERSDLVNSTTARYLREESGLRYKGVVKYFLINEKPIKQLDIWDDVVYNIRKENNFYYYEDKGIFKTFSYPLVNQFIIFSNVIHNYNCNNIYEKIDKVFQNNDLSKKMQSFEVLKIVIDEVMYKNYTIADISKTLIENMYGIGINYDGYMLLYFNNIKSLGWAIFDKYISINGVAIPNKYTIEDFSMFKESSFLGIQYLENNNNVNNIWEIIYNKFKNNEYNKWSDLDNDIQTIPLINEYDINSAYTYAAKLGVQQGIGRQYKNNNWEEIKSLSGFVFAIIESEDELVYLPTRHHFSKQVFYNLRGRYFGWYLISELKQVDGKCKIKIINSYIIEKPVNNLANFIKIFEKSKQMNTDLRSDMKIILNSIFGMFSYKKKSWSFEVFEKEVHEKKKQLGKIYKNIKVYSSNLEENIMRITEFETNQISKYFSLSSFINGQNRINLKNYLFEVKNEKNKGIIYLINVDSFWTNINMRTGENIGDLKLKNKEKKIIFFNRTSSINFTDNYLVFNNKKISDFEKVKEVILKSNTVFSSPILDSKKQVDFVNDFINTSKRKEGKGVEKVTTLYTNHLASRSLLSNILEECNVFLKKKNIKDEYTLEISFKVELNNITQSNCDFIFDLGSLNNELILTKFYQKFDAIYFNWVNAYSEQDYRVLVSYALIMNGKNVIQERQFEINNL